VTHEDKVLSRGAECGKYVYWYILLGSCHFQGVEQNNNNIVKGGVQIVKLFRMLSPFFFFTSHFGPYVCISTSFSNLLGAYSSLRFGENLFHMHAKQRIML
jgi:hypothetical protein